MGDNGCSTCIPSQLYIYLSQRLVHLQCFVAAVLFVGSKGIWLSKLKTYINTKGLLVVYVV